MDIRYLLRKFAPMKLVKSLLCVAAILFLGASVLLSCGNKKTREPRSTKADSVLFAYGAVMNYERVLELVDSFEAKGDISQLNANRWRGVAYYHQGQYRMSEICYRKALDCEVRNQVEQLSYNKSARRLSELLLVKGDYEGALRVAVPAVKKMDESGIGSDIDYAILLNNIGCCQLNLGQDEEANKSFLNAREHYANRWQSDSTSRGFQEAVLGTVYTSMAYINTRRYAESIYWIDRTEMLLNKYMQKPDARREYFDEYQGRIEIMRAVAQIGLGKKKEAAETYKKFLKTNYSKTDVGRINANEYLVPAERYSEAADNYRHLDKMLAEKGMGMTLDNIQLYMLPKFRANMEAGRADSARALGRRLLVLLDTAITGQKNSEMAELATIYDTQGKEAEIVQQQMRMSQQRLLSTAIALILVSVFFIVYTLHKRKASHRLAAAHEKLEDAHTRLQKAYDQLEETTAAKERMESEVRIAHDIQMSMVPSIFPEREGVDMYAYIAPARGVGGDLYSYLLLDHELYYCLGDVSGKGVPASLFMAQAIRLFRSNAKLKHSPATIATRINNELTEDNEQGMFVTMFIGLIDLNTGEMRYCNAGHNPPVLDDEFMEVEANAPIGLWPDLEYVGETIENVKGKPLFIYSDGLNEAENMEQEQFGDDHLLEVLRTGHFNNAREVIEKMTEEVEKHRNGAIPNDDLTMMCLKVS